MSDDKREAFEERTAILEFDAGMTRQRAEQLAAEMLQMTPEDLIEFEQCKINER